MPPRASFVRKHRHDLPDSQIVMQHGFRVTSAERTIIDLACTERFEVALACADAYLRRLTRTERSVDLNWLRAWRDAVLAWADDHPGYRGVRAVRALAHLADPLSDSPLESVSRLRFHQLGIEVEQQAQVTLPNGRRYFLDFLLREQGYFGECDGNVKYLDPQLRGDRAADEVVLEERQRFNTICNATALRGIRWNTHEVASTPGFAAWLASCGVKVPGRAIRKFGDETADFLNMLP